MSNNVDNYPTKITGKSNQSQLCQSEVLVGEGEPEVLCDVHTHELGAAYPPRQHC